MKQDAWPNLSVSIPRRPGLASACVLVPSLLKCPAPKPDFRPAKSFDSASRKTGSPQMPGATGLRDHCARPRPRFISSVRFRHFTELNGATKAVLNSRNAPNPTPLSSRRAGARTTFHIFGETATKVGECGWGCKLKNLQEIDANKFPAHTYHGISPYLQ